MKYLFWAILGMMILLLMSASIKAHAAEVDQVELEYPVVLECWGIDNAKMVRTYLGNIKGFKMFVMEIDTNNDGQKDGMLLFPIFSTKNDEIEISTRAAYVVLDTNYDGVPDVAKFDRTAKGTCSSLQDVPLNFILKDMKENA